MDANKIDKKYEFSLVIPCYNEIEGLPQLIERYYQAQKDINFQLVIVDNGSNDGTFNYLQTELTRSKYQFIKLVKIDKNIGYGYGIFTGLKNCDADIVGWSHGDLQCAPEDVFKAYSIYLQLNNKKVVVKGQRRSRYWKDLFLSYGLDLYTLFVLFRIFNDMNGQPKLFHRDLLKTFVRPPLGFTFDLYSQNKAYENGYFVHGFRVNYPKREFGLSKWAYSTFAKAKTIKTYFIDIIKIRLKIFR